MGNSEARLHKMGGQKAKANLDRKIRNVEKRIEHLEVKEKPKKISKINIDIMPVSYTHLDVYKRQVLRICIRNWRNYMKKNQFDEVFS